MRRRRADWLPNPNNRPVYVEATCADKSRQIIMPNAYASRIAPQSYRVGKGSVGGDRVIVADVPLPASGFNAAIAEAYSA